MLQKHSREQVVIEHIKNLMAVVHPGESFQKVCERYKLDWTPDLINKFTFKAWLLLWEILNAAEQKRIDAWFILMAEKEAEKENAETTG